MAAERVRLQQALQALAGGSAGFLAVSRIHAVGEPSGWREDIAFERGGLQSFARNRSPADAGGARIGRWQAPADDAHAAALVEALLRAEFWNLESDTALAPGAGVINWTCAAGDVVFDLIVGEGSPHALRLAELDLALREIANGLEEQGAGASLRLVVQAAAQGAMLSVRVGLVNDGGRRCVLIGPAQWRGGPDSPNHFRLELAEMPEDASDETGYGANFAPVDGDLLSAAGAAAPWRDDYIVLAPQQALLIPGAWQVGPLPPGEHILRAVYSNYGRLTEVAGMPVIVGRAFSNEVVVRG